MPCLHAGNIKLTCNDRLTGLADFRSQRERLRIETQFQNLPLKSPKQIALVQSKLMNGRVHCNQSVLKGLTGDDTLIGGAD